MVVTQDCLIKKLRTLSAGQLFYTSGCPWPKATVKSPWSLSTTLFLF
jgi:hypothetical protein